LRCADLSMSQSLRYWNTIHSIEIQQACHWMTESVRIDVWQRVPLPPHILQFFWILALTRIVIGTAFPKKGKAVSAATTISRSQRKTPFFSNRGIGEPDSPTRWPDSKIRKRVFACHRRILRYNGRSPHLPHS
jgi:hypothetical protein